MGEDGATGTTETARGSVERVDPTKAQRAVARRVAESKATAPHLYAETEIRPAALERVIHVVARALREHPRLNGAYRDGAFETYSRVNVGVVIGTPGATAVPTIFDADAKEEAQIRDELDRLSASAADGGLTSPDLAGGTFTVVPVSGSVRALTPVLNQGQAGALGVTSATATLACDARMISASEAADFLAGFVAMLEEHA